VRFDLAHTDPFWRCLDVGCRLVRWGAIIALVGITWIVWHALQ